MEQIESLFLLRRFPDALQLCTKELERAVYYEGPNCATTKVQSQSEKKVQQERHKLETRHRRGSSLYNSSNDLLGDEFDDYDSGDNSARTLRLSSSSSDFVEDDEEFDLARNGITRRSSFREFDETLLNLGRDVDSSSLTLPSISIAQKSLPTAQKEVVNRLVLMLIQILFELKRQCEVVDFVQNFYGTVSVIPFPVFILVVNLLISQGDYVQAKELVLSYLRGQQNSTIANNETNIHNNGTNQLHSLMSKNNKGKEKNC
jgi:hypothetical protein